MTKSLNFALALGTLPAQDTAALSPTVTAKAGGGDVPAEAPLRLTASM